MMKEHCKNGGAIFFSTHVLEVAEKLCDKVAIINQGKLIKSGTMAEVKGDESLEEVFFSLFALLLLGVGISFYFMASGLGYVILGHGINWIYFALMSLIAMALGVFGSVFNTYATVYLPKDNELLISLPIPGRTLLLSRLSGVFVISLLYSAWVWIPVMIAYWVKVPVNAWNVVFPLLLMFVIALFVSALSCIQGFVVAVIAVKAKGKSFLRLFLSLGIIGLYYTYLLGRAADGEMLPFILVARLN